MPTPDYSKWKAKLLWKLTEAACLLAGSELEEGTKFDHKLKTGGLPAQIYDDLKNAIDLIQIEFTESRTRYIRDRRVKPVDVVLWGVNRGYTTIPPELVELSKHKPFTNSAKDYTSTKLANLNQAAAKFWGNAKRDDRGTHPKNKQVIAWLVKLGFSETVANKAATIIRPDWAPTGRKPEE